MVIKVDDEICRYYRSLVNAYSRMVVLNASKHGAHITVIAGKYEHPKNKHHWDKYNNQKIRFDYDPYIKTNDEYFWMEVKCPKIEKIREELGLTPRITIPWHLTVGNLK